MPTARRIVANGEMEKLVEHITDKRWREVFLLAVGISPHADCLLRLMKQQVDALIAADEKLQQFLSWLNQKAHSVKLCHKTAAIRAFYLELTGSFSLGVFPTADLSHTIDQQIELLK